jgi:hypothetical protein
MHMGLVERWLATRQGFKPRDVEEFIDFHWHRPLAGLLVQAIRDTGVTPNQVTYASGVFSLLSGAAIGLGAVSSPWWASLGAVLLLVSIVLDCADGQLARIKGISSPVGRILDGTMDAVAPLCVFHGMAFYLLGQGFTAPWIWPIGLAAGGSLLWHASQYDAGKNVYLHASRPDFSLGGNTLLTVEDMRRWQREFEDKGERWNALLMRVWANWTKPQLNQLLPWLGPERTPQDDAERAAYRELMFPVMRVLSWLGFGTHLFILTMAALLAPLDARAIWIAWGLILGPMNVACVWVAIVRPRRERAFVARLAEMRAGAPASTAEAGDGATSAA